MTITINVNGGDGDILKCVSFFNVDNNTNGFDIYDDVLHHIGTIDDLDCPDIKDKESMANFETIINDWYDNNIL